MIIAEKAEFRKKDTLGVFFEQGFKRPCMGAMAPASVLKGVAALQQVFQVIALIGNVTERTRREIAAYIAEGSMTPEQGERLMKAGDRTDA